MQTTRVPLSTNTNGLCTQGLESSNYMSCSAQNAITVMRKRSIERSKEHCEQLEREQEEKKCALYMRTSIKKTDVSTQHAAIGSAARM